MTGCASVCGSIFTRSARVGYCVLFSVMLMLAEILRDYARPMMEKIPWIAHYSGSSATALYGQQAVFRVSLGSFLFYGMLSMALVGVERKNDSRAKFLHHGSWGLKFLVWVLCLAVPFFMPDDVMEAYVWAARFGSGLFLLVQMLIILDFAYLCNESWAEKDSTKWYAALLACTLGAYGTSFAMIAWMYHTYGGSDCGLNKTFITLTWVTFLLMSAVSLHPKAKPGSLFPSAVISCYCTFLCYSALSSEPVDYECNTFGRGSTLASRSSVFAGMAVTLASVVYSALRAGSTTGVLSVSEEEPDSRLLADEEAAEEATGSGNEGEHATKDSAKNEDASDSDAPVAYNYSFFHLIFALASMYIGMLMTSWGTEDLKDQEVDVGWTSVWIKMAVQWVTVLLFSWSLIAPAVLPDREF